MNICTHKKTDDIGIAYGANGARGKAWRCTECGVCGADWISTSGAPVIKPVLMRVVK